MEELEKLTDNELIILFADVQTTIKENKLKFNKLQKPYYDRLSEIEGEIFTRGGRYNK